MKIYTEEKFFLLFLVISVHDNYFINKLYKFLRIVISLENYFSFQISHIIINKM